MRPLKRMISARCRDLSWEFRIGDLDVDLFELEIYRDGVELCIGRQSVKFLEWIFFSPGLSAENIAEKMNTTPSNVKAGVSRLRKLGFKISRGRYHVETR